MKVNVWMTTNCQSKFTIHILYSLGEKKRQHKSILVKHSIHLCFSMEKKTDFLALWDLPIYPSHYICKTHVFLTIAFQLNAELPLAPEVREFAYYADFFTFTNSLWRLNADPRNTNTGTLLIHSTKNTSTSNYFLLLSSLLARKKGRHSLNN